MKLYWLRFYFFLPSLVFGKNVCGEKIGVKYFLRRKKCTCNNEFEETFANNSTSNKVSFSNKGPVKKKWGWNFPCAEKMHMLFVILNLKTFWQNSTSNKTSFNIKNFCGETMGVKFFLHREKCTSHLWYWIWGDFLPTTQLQIKFLSVPRVLWRDSFKGTAEKQTRQEPTTMFRRTTL